MTVSRTGIPPSGDSISDGDLRTLVLGDGGRVEERITSRTDRSYTYVILESPLPVADYASTITVAATPSGSTVTWSSTFAAAAVSDEQAVELVTGFYRAGLVSAKHRSC